ncbi:hypothetical protein Ahy_B02g060294 [Arachis hypogaea]|uniref:Ubiquitin-like protease family profile domain-containing protein n=1 Tax=Arachis hypogaea TaxID=3818 RepID=A0A445AI83_ARAHY|nr:hypothetical protein Ahy_B02g060294 [Arachis hypogaea]
METIREKRSKKRNDGAQSANIAPNQFDSPEAQNEFSQTVPIVNLDSEQVLQTQGSSTPSVNAASNTRHRLALSLPSSVQEELIRDDFIHVPSVDVCPPEPRKQGVTVSLTSSVIEDLIKDDYVYEISDEDPAKQQQQQSQETPISGTSTTAREEPTAQQSKQEAPVDVCPPEPENQGVTVSFTSSVIEEFFKDDYVYEVSDEEQREDERPSFNLGISPLASQPTQPSQPSVSQLEILEESVVDAGVTAALKFAKATTLEPTLPAAEVYKTPEKKIKITNELIEKCYHWMTHVKKTRDGSNEYNEIFVLKHEALYEGLREYFMSLMPKEHVHVMVNSLPVNDFSKHSYIVYLINFHPNFMLVTHGESYTDKRTNKAYRFDIEQYAHHRQFLDKRKLASHPFLFVPICNGAHWLLWIANVNKKKFYVLDPVNKLPEAEYILLNGHAQKIDSFRYQYGPHILLHEMNKIRDQVIWESEAIIFPKSSVALSNPY